MGACAILASLTQPKTEIMRRPFAKKAGACRVLVWVLVVFPYLNYQLANGRRVDGGEW